MIILCLFLLRRSSLHQFISPLMFLNLPRVCSISSPQSADPHIQSILIVLHQSSFPFYNPLPTFHCRIEFKYSLSRSYTYTKTKCKRIKNRTLSPVPPRSCRNHSAAPPIHPRQASRHCSFSFSSRIEVSLEFRKEVTAPQEAPRSQRASRSSLVRRSIQLRLLPPAAPLPSNS